MNVRIATSVVFLWACGDAVAQVSQQGAITAHSPATAVRAPSDYANAKPFALPMARVAPAQAAVARAAAGRAARQEPSGSVDGARGTGEAKPVRVAPEPPIAETAAAAAAVEREDAGELDHVFTTSRVNMRGDNSFRFYPYRAVGKLFFNDGSGARWCSGALIKPGVVLTAAHCVTDFGTRAFHSNFEFIPAYHRGVAPFGAWSAQRVFVVTSYFTGTDGCAVPGVVCQNDVALIVLRPQSGDYPGNHTGYLGYAWGKAGFNAMDQALITQLGFPLALDGGELMQRNDSQSYNGGTDFSNNTIIGTEMSGGSSGGPWIVNFGQKPFGYLNGRFALRNKIVGVTSWGYTVPTVKEQGASRFTTDNIVPLVDRACAAFPAAC